MLLFYQLNLIAITVLSVIFFFRVKYTLLYYIQVVAGGGAVEAALSVYLEYLATTLGSREQLAIAEFAESLLIIPKVHVITSECLGLGSKRNGK